LFRDVFALGNVCIARGYPKTSLKREASEIWLTRK